MTSFLQFLRDVVKPALILEIGCGSGVVSAFVATLLASRRAAHFCTDLNSHALRCTRQTAAQNVAETPLDVVNCDLACAFRLRGAVDVLLFNPPYVPTNESANERAVCISRII